MHSAYFIIRITAEANANQTKGPQNIQQIQMVFVFFTVQLVLAEILKVKLTPTDVH